MLGTSKLLEQLDFQMEYLYLDLTDNDGNAKLHSWLTQFEAIEYLEVSIAICQELGDVRGATLSQVNLGVAYYKRGDLDEAGTVLQQALNTLQNLGDLAHAAVALGNLGLIYRARGELDTAEACFQESLAASRASNDKPGESQALSNLGLIHKARGEFDEALDCHQTDVAICEETGDTYGLVTALLNRALIHADRGDWEAVHQDGGRDWQLALTEGYRDMQARLSLLWGREALLKGDDKNAAGHWREALEAAEQAGVSERAEVKAALERVLALLPRRRRKQLRRHIELRTDAE